MRSSTWMGIAGVAGTLAVAGAAVSYQAREHRYYAEVISAKLITTRVEAPRERCYQEMVRPSPQAWATALNQHHRRKAAMMPVDTETSAIADSPDTYLAQRCETVYDAEQQPAGYDVRYHYAGKSGTVHMDHDPGKRIPVENGELVLNSDPDDDNAAIG